MEACAPLTGASAYPICFFSLKTGPYPTSLFSLKLGPLLNLPLRQEEADGEQDIRLDKEELAVAEWIERDKIDQAQDSYDDLSLTNEMMMAFKHGKM